MTSAQGSSERSELSIGKPQCECSALRRLRLPPIASAGSFAYTSISFRQSTRSVRKQLASLISADTMNRKAGLILVQVKSTPSVLEHYSERTDVELISFVKA